MSNATRDAKRAEKQKRERLAEKERAYIDFEIESLYKGQIILDFDLTTKEVLAEVEPKFVPLLKTHQIEGVKFLFNSMIESVEIVKSNKDEKTSSFGCILAHSMGLGKVSRKSNNLNFEILI